MFIPNRFKLIKKLKKKLKNFFWVKKILGYNSLDLVMNDYGLPISIKGYHLCNHDLYHLEISKLERIQIGKHMVSGIHGINSPIFHNSSITEEYESFLDEARVAFHEWLTRTSPINTIKAFVWVNLLIFNKINPFAVIYRHHKTLSKKKLE